MLPFQLQDTSLEHKGDHQGRVQRGQGERGEGSLVETLQLHVPVFTEYLDCLVLRNFGTIMCVLAMLLYLWHFRGFLHNFGNIMVPSSYAREGSCRGQPIKKIILTSGFH